MKYPYKIQMSSKYHWSRLERVLCTIIMNEDIKYPSGRFVQHT